jgi:hypothetical protein
MPRDINCTPSLLCPQGHYIFECEAGFLTGCLSRVCTGTRPYLTFKKERKVPVRACAQGAMRIVSGGNERTLNFKPCTLKFYSYFITLNPKP